MEAKPNVHYQWKEDEKFEISGRELEIYLNSTRAILSTPESQRVLLLAKINEMLENVIVQGLKDGKVTEMQVQQEPTAE